MSETQKPGDSGAIVPLILIGLVVAIGGYLGVRWWQVERHLSQQSMTSDDADIDLPMPTLTDFTLTERSGKPFRSQDMVGKVWVVSYFFTSCPGSCVRLNNNIDLLHNDTALSDVTFVSITCDPDQDTVEQLSEYADRRNADPDRWLFARGELDYVKNVGLAMNLDVYERSHKAYCVVIGRNGNLRGAYELADIVNADRDVARLREKLIELLEEPAGDTT